MNYSFEKTKKKRVLVAMSGGVDSSVAAALLCEQGYDVIGVTMQVWDYSSNQCATDEGNGTCCSSLDVDDARAVADKLQIPFYVINCEEKFKVAVIDQFVASYLKGETPIPCVNCNTFLKFDYLIQKMKELDCDYLATGHYAHIEKTEDRSLIVSSQDSWKDQTYFLFTLNPDIIDKLLFPLGTWQKSDVRAYAEKMGLAVARKKDSTGICFIGKSGYAGFIESQVDKDKLKPGLIKLFPTGETIGEHTGVHNFTIGQRRGLGVAVGRPVYTVRIDMETSTVWMGDEEHLYSDSAVISDVNWMLPLEAGRLHAELADGLVDVKIRFAHKATPARLVKKSDERYELHFIEKQRAVTVGQAAVFYKNKKLLGGGWITQAKV